MSPLGRNRHELAMWNECRFIASIRQRKIQVGFRRHVQHLGLDRAQRCFYIPSESSCATHIVGFPCAHLQDQIVGIGTGYEARSEMLHHLREATAERWLAAPQFAAPPL